MEPLSLSQSFLMRGACWGMFAVFGNQPAEMPGSSSAMDVWTGKTSPPKQLFSVLTKTLSFFLPPPPF